MARQQDDEVMDGLRREFKRQLRGFPREVKRQMTGFGRRPLSPARQRLGRGVCASDRTRERVAWKGARGG